MKMQIQGMEITRAAIRKVIQELYHGKSLAVKDFTRQATVVTQERTPKDTGALRASIKMRVDSDSMFLTKTHISVGDPSIKRGEGPFTTSSKTGQIVGVRPTSEYAGLVESKQGFVNNAMGWIDKRWKTYFKKAFRRAFR